MPRRALSFRTFDEAVAEIDRLHRSGYEKTGNWTLGQICQHLALSMERPMRGTISKAPLPLRVVGPLYKKRFFRNRKVPAGVRGNVAIMPQEEVDEPKEVVRAIDVFRQMEKFPGPFPPHPIFGELTPAEWRDFQLIHAAHHLAFLTPARNGHE